ncbi:hypothetical protein DPEC_G00204500 [Dallia pectoralis]|uniref:Uncharacterized protein n=1 Tax=Dallia pectoralis TaxID=75939 RepID=A0ACC2G9V7_DALPE|nr:hypothetical protein DPEC_G00204500 [Dallia pectoralis]
MSVTISTLNTRSIRYPDRRRTVLGHLTTKPADIFLLQECGIPYKEMDGLLEEGWTLGSSFWSGSNIAILMTNPYIRPKASCVVESGRILVLDLEIQGSPLRVINVYGPTNVAERVSLYRKLRSLLLVSTPVLVGGISTVHFGTRTAASQGETDPLKSFKPSSMTSPSQM